MNKNILGGPLLDCGCEPMTGFYRDGQCRTNAEDTGTHVVCAVVTREFLEFTLNRGNDLVRAVPQWNFPGLKPGDRWCLCVSRWLEAEKAGVAPPIVLEATHQKALEFATLELFQAYAFSE